MITKEQIAELNELISLMHEYASRADYVGCVTAVYFRVTRMHLAIRRKAADRPPVKEQPTKEIVNAEETKPASESAEPRTEEPVKTPEAPVEQEASGG